MVTFDNRDCGQSSYAAGPYEITDLAADAIALADQLELDSFHLVGASMGGAIAQEIALGWPERVRTLTLAITFGGAGAYGRKIGRMMAADVQRRTYEEQIDQMMLLCFSEDLFDQTERITFLRQQMLANPHPQKPEGFARQAEATGPPRGARAAALAEDAGARDRRGARHPRAGLEIEGAGRADPGRQANDHRGATHGLNLERADDFNAAVLEFLRSEQPSPA